MSSETSLVAKEIRLKEWALQIQECQNRPKSMDVETWCSEHGITKATYYYRLRKVREKVLENVKNSPSPTFVEIPTVIEDEIQSSLSTDSMEANLGALLTIGSKQLQISNQASEGFLRNLVRAMQSC